MKERAEAGHRRHSLVQIIERVGDAHCHLHSGLRRQLLDGCITLLPERLRVVLVGQTRNIPFLGNTDSNCSVRLKASYGRVFEAGVTLNSLGKTSVGWPRITNSRELSFRRLESKSSRLCSKNLKDDTGASKKLQNIIR